MAISIHEIVSGKETQKWLKLYLNMFPHSGHSADIERLCYFTIALYRYKSNFSIAKLEDHLRKDRKWNEDQIEVCVNRILYGLDVLQARSTFAGAYFNG